MNRKLIGDGYVELVDVMGSDESIARIAGISYGKYECTPEQMKRRINLMMKKGHTSPFEFAELIFKVRCPMDVWRQWIRHRTASVLEHSTRYSTAFDAKKIGEADEIRSSNNTLSNQNAMEIINQSLDNSKQAYDKLLQLGVHREQARTVLPLATYTEAYWKIDLHNLFNFLRLRMDSSAQKEIRDYAFAVHDLVYKKFPISTAAFHNFVLFGKKISMKEHAKIATRIGMQLDSFDPPKSELEKIIEMGFEEFEKSFMQDDENNNNEM